MLFLNPRYSQMGVFVSTTCKSSQYYDRQHKILSFLYKRGTVVSYVFHSVSSLTTIITDNAYTITQPQCQGSSLPAFDIWMAVTTPQCRPILQQLLTRPRSPCLNGQDDQYNLHGTTSVQTTGGSQRRLPLGHKWWQVGRRGESTSIYARIT